MSNENKAKNSVMPIDNTTNNNKIYIANKNIFKEIDRKSKVNIF